MNRPILLLLSASTVIGATAVAGAQTTTAPQQPASVPAAAAPAGAGTVTLKAPNNQGPTGSATIAQQGDDVVITLHAPSDQTTAAVFSGSCNGGKPQSTGPATALNRLTNGTSQTVVPHTKVNDLMSTPHAIVVQGGTVSPLCGDVSTITPH
ncbi:MAG: hypothetical protein JO241_02095 [Candidatus Eremiobacteraeota bacterium]|nr:hypothetical protein [Candidatus Eremiobacteraeota bacterium]MBV8582760.1 hypothetical protein [Candidatus Eremiobacteraeota bacterium]